VIFAWDEENTEHIARHAVTADEAEFVLQRAKIPFPQSLGEGKFRVWGTAENGRMLQVIYVLKAQSEVAYSSVDPLDWETLQDDRGAKIVRVIHAMELTDDMKRQLRRHRPGNRR